MSTERYDAVVIGSGPNGLSAAITLARAGRSVLVVEAAPALGGALATEELTLPGFHHDVFSAVHPASVASPVFADFELERHGLSWIHPEIAMAHPLPGGRAAVLSRDLARTRASLDALCDDDGRRWQALVEPYLRHWDAVRATMLAGFPPAGGPVKLAAGLQARRDARVRAAAAVERRVAGGRGLPRRGRGLAVRLGAARRRAAGLAPAARSPGST